VGRAAGLRRTLSPVIMRATGHGGRHCGVCVWPWQAAVQHAAHMQAARAQPGAQPGTHLVHLQKLDRDFVADERLHHVHSHHLRCVRRRRAADEPLHVRASWAVLAHQLGAVSLLHVLAHTQLSGCAGVRTAYTACTMRAATHRSELADGHKAVVGAVLDEQAALVGAVHLDGHGEVLLLQLPDALPENGGLRRGGGGGAARVGLHRCLRRRAWLRVCMCVCAYVRAVVGRGAAVPVPATGCFVLGPYPHPPPRLLSSGWSARTRPRHPPPQTPASCPPAGPRRAAG